MTGVMMSTQQDNREVAEGHSLADKYFLNSLLSLAWVGLILELVLLLFIIFELSQSSGSIFIEYWLFFNMNNRR